MQAFMHLVFPNSPLAVLPEGSSSKHDEPFEHGIITSVTHGAMPGISFHRFFLFHTSSHVLLSDSRSSCIIYDTLDQSPTGEIFSCFLFALRARLFQLPRSWPCCFCCNLRIFKEKFAERWFLRTS